MKLLVRHIAILAITGTLCLFWSQAAAASCTPGTYFSEFNSSNNEDEQTWADYQAVAVDAATLFSLGVKQSTEDYASDVSQLPLTVIGRTGQYLIELEGHRNSYFGESLVPPTLSDEGRMTSFYIIDLELNAETFEGKVADNCV